MNFIGHGTVQLSSAASHPSLAVYATYCFDLMHDLYFEIKSFLKQWICCIIDDKMEVFETLLVSFLRLQNFYRGMFADPSSTNRILCDTDYCLESSAVHVCLKTLRLTNMFSKLFRNQNYPTLRIHHIMMRWTSRSGILAPLLPSDAAYQKLQPMYKSLQLLLTVYTKCAAYIRAQNDWKLKIAFPKNFSILNLFHTIR